MRVHQPLELYLTCFTLAEGLGSVAYHRHIRAGEGLGQEDGTCLQVIEEAWKQGTTLCHGGLARFNGFQCSV